MLQTAGALESVFCHRYKRSWRQKSPNHEVACPVPVVTARRDYGLLVGDLSHWNDYQRYREAVELVRHISGPSTDALSPPLSHPTVQVFRKFKRVLVSRVCICVSIN